MYPSTRAMLAVDVHQVDLQAATGIRKGALDRICKGFDALEDDDALKIVARFGADGIDIVRAIRQTHTQRYAKPVRPLPSGLREIPLGDPDRLYTIDEWLACFGPPRHGTTLEPLVEL
jgi:hypothetical protein